MSRRYLRAGDQVVLRTPDEIGATLDADGTLDSLPFMPEMLSCFGRRLRVARRAEKTCVEGHWTQRRFPGNDVVLLEEIRCSGDEHDECRRGCMIFWKEAWLRRVSPEDDIALPEESAIQRLRARLEVKTDATHYHCQSTRLASATEYFPPTYKFGVIPQMAWVALREIWVGNRSVFEMAGLMAQWLGLSIRKRRIGDRVLLIRGPNRRTPTRALGLRPGERVRIKSAPEIEQTLDQNSANRGLRMSTAMTMNCGREYEVLDRVDRIIVETTGQMRELKNTVSLRGLECLCYYNFGSCPRGDLQYWREIWLERTRLAPEPAGATRPANGTRDAEVP